ncbi:MAG: cbbZC [Acidimicrobiales bacterium]|nr:cbbZC [Acidimicrobiales bacterium]
MCLRVVRGSLGRAGGHGGVRRAGEQCHRPEPAAALIAIFDLDGTLVDSDEALAAPLLELGVPRERITFGRLLADECALHGVSVEDYLDRYDPTVARPFAGVDELVAGLDRWAVCSHKARVSGQAELARLGWQPELALFAEDFGPAGKDLAPVLDAFGVTGAEVVFVGDTAHDRACARAAGATFVLAGWNARARPEPGDVVAARPLDVLEVL